MRTEVRSVEISEVLAEARAALDRTRTELRQAKRLYPDGVTSACQARALNFWLDMDPPDTRVVDLAIVVDGQGGPLSLSGRVSEVARCGLNGCTTSAARRL